MASFEHIAQRLVGGSVNAVKAAEDDEKKKKDDEKDAKKVSNEDDEREKDKEDKHGKKAEEPKKEDEKEDAKGSKGKKKADDDSDEPEARSAEAERAASARHYRAGRTAERVRIREILNSPEAKVSAGSADTALDFALNTDEPVDVACAHVRSYNRGFARAEAAAKATGSDSQREALRERMAQTPNPPVDAGVDDNAGPTLAERIILAGKRRRGEIK